MQAAENVHEQQILLNSLAKIKLAVPAPSGPSLLQCIVKTDGNSFFISHLCPLVLSKLLQPT